MAFGLLDKVQLIEELENWLERNRPPEEVRAQLDLSYRIERQTIYLFTIRPRWDKPSELMHLDFAKLMYVKRQDCWKPYWQRASLKWDLYQTDRPLKTLRNVLDCVDADDHGCFHG